MITFLRGIVFAAGVGYVDVDVHGVGYRVFITESWAGRLNAGEDIFVFTHHHVREDAVQLLGFETQDERDWFELLIGVSGIGPKGAMQILSGATYSQCADAILDEDFSFLATLPGVGKKTAQRLVVELKDKVVARSNPGKIRQQPNQAGRTSGSGGIESDVLDALASLGYAERHVTDEVRTVMGENPGLGVEDVLRLCLQRLARVR